MNFWVGLLIGLILGWLIEWIIDWLFWRRRDGDSSAEAELREQLAAAEARYRSAEADCRAQLSVVEAANRDLRRQLDEALGIAVVADASREAPEMPIVRMQETDVRPSAEDDLTLLEGIGPVYSARLRESGIRTFAQLAASDEATLARIIDAPTWRRIRYGDWIAQARLAAAGNEAGLRALQDELFKRHGDNLSLIKGVGPRTAEALSAAGITTFAALAAATPEELQAALAAGGVRLGDYDYVGWIEEARLRAAGKRIRQSRTRVAQFVSCPQDLSAVSGIGSVYEQRLYLAGIGSYWELAETPVDELAAILDIKDYQAVDLEAIKAAAMELAVQTNSVGRGWDGTPPDDFEQLSGVGEIYERRLYNAGICTFEALAATTIEQLTEICQVAGGRRPDFEDWISQARRLAGAKGAAGQ